MGVSLRKGEARHYTGLRPAHPPGIIRVSMKSTTSGARLPGSSPGPTVSQPAKVSPPPPPRAPLAPEPRYEVRALVVEEKGGKPVGHARYDIRDQRAKTLASGETDWTGLVAWKTANAGAYNVQIVDVPPAGEAAPAPGATVAAMMDADGPDDDDDGDPDTGNEENAALPADEMLYDEA